MGKSNGRGAAGKSIALQCVRTGRVLGAKSNSTLRAVAGSCLFGTRSRTRFGRSSEQIHAAARSRIESAYGFTSGLGTSRRGTGTAEKRIGSPERTCRADIICGRLFQDTVDTHGARQYRERLWFGGWQRAGDLIGITPCAYPTTEHEHVYAWLPVARSAVEREERHIIFPAVLSGDRIHDS